MFGGVAHAAEQGLASGGNGFFTQKIGIDVPAFRGLEPKIAFSYSSARKTRLGGLYQGWLGYAWGLDGFDVIERASPGVACRGLISEGWVRPEMMIIVRPLRDGAPGVIEAKEQTLVE
ncbi:hypothetical protein JL39_11100 [Rhizobium sp. YS-1r]|nr:hypothetical protein JL39_11100 [Rhizobium sp. YS-1r]